MFSKMLRQQKKIDYAELAYYEAVLTTNFFL